MLRHQRAAQERAGREARHQVAAHVTLQNGRMQAAQRQAVGQQRHPALQRQVVQRWQPVAGGAAEGGEVGDFGRDVEVQPVAAQVGGGANGREGGALSGGGDFHRDRPMAEQAGQAAERGVDDDGQLADGELGRDGGLISRRWGGGAEANETDHAAERGLARGQAQIAEPGPRQHRVRLDRADGGKWPAGERRQGGELRRLHRHRRALGSPGDSRGQPVAGQLEIERPGGADHRPGRAGQCQGQAVGDQLSADAAGARRIRQMRGGDLH